MVFIIFIALMLGSTLTTTCASVKSPAESIAQLRKDQQTASYAEYFELERDIAGIKREHSARVSSKRLEPLPTWIISWNHLLPFIFWQMIALIAAFLFFIVRSRSLALVAVMLLATATVGAVYRERAYSWLVITEPQKNVYIGPGTGYPVSGELAYLDEVLILNNKKNSQEQWYKVYVGDHVGWIQSDVGGA